MIPVLNPGMIADLAPIITAAEVNDLRDNASLRYVGPSTVRGSRPYAWFRDWSGRLTLQANPWPSPEFSVGPFTAVSDPRLPADVVELRHSALGIPLVRVRLT